MRKYILDSDLLSKKTTAAYSMLNDMLPVLDKIEETSKEAFEEINAHDELGNVDYTSIKNNMEHIEEYMDKYKVFGAVSSGAGQNSSSGYNYNMSTVGYSSSDGFIGEYQREVDDVFYNVLVKTIKKLRDSKLQDIRIDNNAGIQGERPASIFDMNTKVSDGIDKDKIGLEDLLGFGRISMAIHQEYEQIKSQIDAYNASLPKYSSENASKFLLDFISKLIFDSEIDKEKINSCGDYIKKMVTSSDFDYETNGERTASIAADFIPVFGGLKMLGEIVEGKDLVSGKHYSTGEQLFGLGTLGAGSLLGKIYKGIKAGMSPEVEEAAGKLSNGTVFAMNGAGGASEIEKLTKNITKKIVGKGEGASETSYVKSIADLKNVEKFKKGSLEHILEGQLNARGKAVGFHYEGMPTAKGKIIPGTESVPNEFGVYTAKVEVNGVPKTANGGMSSFFPKDWDAQNIVDGINEAYGSKEFVQGSRNTFRGKTSQGIRIEMYIDSATGKIISAFPIY